MESLIEKLQAIRNAQNLTDRQFAQLLEISPAMWCYLQQGKRKIGTKLLKTVAQKFPGLGSFIVQLLSEGAPNNPSGHK